MNIPKPKKPPYTPTTSVLDTLVGPPPQRNLFSVATTSQGLATVARTEKKTLIGGTA